MITTLIDKLDSVELVRDQIAAILVTEIAQQQVLAAAASKDADLWLLRVFTERSNPWEEYIDAPKTFPEIAPIVNVEIASETFEARASNVVERQRGIGLYHIDCWGYGVAEDDGGDGHTPGDAKSALEAQRAARLVRNIIMSSPYTYLDLRGTVGKRWVQSITMLKPPSEDRAVQQIAAARIVIQVEFNEFAPQYVGQTLELIAGTVRRKETGEIYLKAHHVVPP